MALTMEFDARSNTLRLTIEGPLTDTVMFDVFQAAVRYGQTHPPCRSITDLSKVTIHEVSSEAVRELAKVPASGHSLPRVVVAAKDYSYAMSRMYQILSERTRPNLHVVHTMEEAYRLLKIEKPDFRPLDPES